MKLIGITGRKRSGKDTVADMIIKQLAPKVVIKIGFADALKEEVAKATGKSRDFIETNKSHFRLILQGWGTDFRRELDGKNYWINKLGVKILALENVDMVIVPDVRFLNEAQFINEAGGMVIGVTRAGLIPDNHPSEQEQLLIPCKDTISNDTTLIDLEMRVTTTIKYLKLNE